MFLEVKNFSKAYHGNYVVNNVSFSVDKGKMLCILGPSGCGKTTILNGIGGFLSDIEGHIIIDGQDVTYLPAEERPVSTVFQSYGLFPHMSVLDNVKYGLKFQKLSTAERINKAKQMLDKVGLSAYDTHKIHNLSGGQKQRVALARSLVVRPKILLLDEPLSNLDAKMRESLREEIKQIQQEFQITTVLVTHDQQEAFELADQIILLNEGEIEQVSPAVELYDYPANEFSANFIGEINQVDNRYVRPEKIYFTEKGEPGIIEGIVFRGETIDLKIRITNNEFLRMTVLNDTKYYIGQNVKINYTENSIRLKEKN